MRARRAAGTALAVVLVAGPAGAAAPAVAASQDGLPLGTSVVAGQDVPVLATFAYASRQDDTGREVRGVLHGVRRVDGGTALYYSLGATGAEPFVGFQAMRQAERVTDVGSAWDVQLVDAENLLAYRPLRTSEGLAVSPDTAFDGDGGTLHVAFAVFPELPADVDAVQVVMPNGTVVGEVDVEDGALAPASQEPSIRPGEGWPELPDAAALGSADADASTSVLTRRSSDLAQEVTVEESPEQVDVSLDASVLFAFDSADLTPEAQSRLADVAADIAARATGEVVVTGHTDSDGDAGYNQTLSEQRAQSVVAALQGAAGSAVTFSAVGRGASEPVASNDTEEGKQANRRVTVAYAVEGQR